MKKKVINILTIFFISYKSDIKNFLKWIINECPKGTRQHDSFLNTKIVGMLKDMKNRERCGVRLDN